MQKSVALLALLLLAGCTSEKPAQPDPLELIIALEGNGTAYSTNDLVNISVFVKNNINATYSINITLMREDQVDYVWEQNHEQLISNYERWNIWKENPGVGNWTVIVQVQPYNSSLVLEKNGTFIVK